MLVLNSHRTMGKVSEFYSGKRIFVSGATGFCGKILLEKLLRECSDIAKVYLLIRGKENGKRLRRIAENYAKYYF